MGGSREKATVTGAHLLLYDGDCGLCHLAVRFVLKRDGRGLFQFASQQGPAGRRTLERHGRNLPTPASLYVVEHHREADARLMERSEAVLFVASRLGWPWPLAAWLRIVPASLRDAAYGVIARHRHRLAGDVDRCEIASPAMRERFID